MIKTDEAVSIRLTPISIIKGDRDTLIYFLQTMCDEGFFTNGYERICGHFAFDCQRLSADVPPSETIEWGNIKSKSEILRFCYFLRDSELIEQNLSSVWVHFSYKGKQLPENSYSLAAASNQHYPELYKLVKDTGLRIILKEYQKVVRC
jgi:hypothetical protein